jgi:hypothetical protein
MMILALRTKDPLNISGDLAQHTLLRERHQIAIFGGVHQRLGGRLPFRSVVF